MVPTRSNFDNALWWVFVALFAPPHSGVIKQQLSSDDLLDMEGSCRTEWCKSLGNSFQADTVNLIFSEDIDSSSDTEEILNSDSDEENKLLCLTKMGYSEAEASIAMERCGSAKLTERILKALEAYDDEPPLSVQKYVLDECRKWNLVWVGRNKVVLFEPDEVEMITDVQEMNDDRLEQLMRCADSTLLLVASSVTTLPEEINIIRMN
ncbi:hypothetical protein F3Y22_tig00111210pilonHSYRG00319 [Hibiscus syriacus]|uniref:DNA (Cytosine-5)-methyltransferase DRM1/2 n=1 Tax=Hibiscus syriacus TaxID=106335 RepID=A0A6A2YVH0_HIBSY|nr:hypothetical protein F3Y22_tig00111210pilonHSYRG00319 [Hibiscus syriacus]